MCDSNTRWGRTEKDKVGNYSGSSGNSGGWRTGGDCAMAYHKHASDKNTRIVSTAVQEVAIVDKHVPGGKQNTFKSYSFFLLYI